MIGLSEPIKFEVFSELLVNFCCFVVEDLRDVLFKFIIIHFSVLLWDVATLRKLQQEFLLQTVLDIWDGHVELLQESKRQLFDNLVELGISSFKKFGVFVEVDGPIMGTLKILDLVHELQLHIFFHFSFELIEVNQSKR